MEFTDYNVSPKQMDVSLGVPKKGMENPAKLNDFRGTPFVETPKINPTLTNQIPPKPSEHLLPKWPCPNARVY